MKTQDAMMNGIVTLGKFGLTIGSLERVLTTLLDISGLAVEKLPIISGLVDRKSVSRFKKFVSINKV